MPRTKALNGAFCESFVYAHALATSAPRRDLYTAFLQEHFIQPMRQQKGAWWLAGGGRFALNLSGLVYCRERLGRDPDLERAILEASCAMFAPLGRDSLYASPQGDMPKPPADEWLYLCFGYLSLADLARPMASMDGLVPREPGR